MNATIISAKRPALALVVGGGELLDEPGEREVGSLREPKAEHRLVYLLRDLGTRVDPVELQAELAHLAAKLECPNPTREMRR